MPTISFEESTYRIIIQLTVAFGQGAGTMRVTHKTVDAATADYKKLIDDCHVPWEEIEVTTLELARSLGRYAAHLAVQEGHDVIDESHYREARLKFKTKILCSFCLKRGLVA